MKKSQLLKLRVDQLIFLRRNPQYLTPHQMEALKVSIERDGFLAPILVRRKGAKYEILSGNHRAMALKELAVKEISAVCIQATDREARRLAINLNTIHGNPTAELLVPFLADFEPIDLTSLHFDDKMIAEMSALDANMAKMFAQMDVPDAWNQDSNRSEIGNCRCPACGRSHIRGSGKKDGIPAGKKTPG
jgi:hypothetical protein